MFDREVVGIGPSDIWCLLQEFFGYYSRHSWYLFRSIHFFRVYLQNYISSQPENQLTINWFLNYKFLLLSTRNAHAHVQITLKPRSVQNNATHMVVVFFLRSVWRLAEPRNVLRQSIRTRVRKIKKTTTNKDDVVGGGDMASTLNFMRQPAATSTCPSFANERNVLYRQTCRFVRTHADTQM